MTGGLYLEKFQALILKVTPAVLAERWKVKKGHDFLYSDQYSFLLTKGDWTPMDRAELDEAGHTGRDLKGSAPWECETCKLQKAADGGRHLASSAMAGERSSMGTSHLQLLNPPLKKAIPVVPV